MCYSTGEVTTYPYGNTEWQCSRCSNCGHVSASCPDAVPGCKHCGAPHPSRACPSEQRVLYNAAKDMSGEVNKQLQHVRESICIDAVHPAVSERPASPPRKSTPQCGGTPTASPITHPQARSGGSSAATAVGAVCPAYHHHLVAYAGPYLSPYGAGVQHPQAAARVPVSAADFSKGRGKGGVYEYDTEYRGHGKGRGKGSIGKGSWIATKRGSRVAKVVVRVRATAAAIKLVPTPSLCLDTRRCTYLN